MAPRIVPYKSFHPAIGDVGPRSDLSTDQPLGLQRAAGISHKLDARSDGFQILLRLVRPFLEIMEIDDRSVARVS